MKQVASLTFLVSLVVLLPVMVNAETPAVHSILLLATSNDGSVNWLPLDAPEPSVEPGPGGAFQEIWPGLIFQAPGQQGNLEVDAIISGNINTSLQGDFEVLNFASVDVTFTLAFDMNAAPLSAPTQTSGSIDVLELRDNNTNGAELSSHGPDPVYQSLIDGVNYQALMLSVYSLSAPAGGTSGASDSFSGVGGAVNSTLGTELAFTLTAGDFAHITTDFTVVPEPTTSALLAVGALCLVGFIVRRRKLSR